MRPAHPLSCRAVAGAIPLVLAALFAGCETPRDAEDPYFWWRNGPTSITIDGRPLTLETDLECDPHAPNDSMPQAFRGTVTLRAEGGEALPAGISVPVVWVNESSTIWSVNPELLPESTASAQVYWIENLYLCTPPIVQVIADVVEADSTRHWLRAADQQVDILD